MQDTVATPTTDPHKPDLLPITEDPNDWVTVPQFHERVPFVTGHQLRWVLRDRETNGLAPAVRKIGKRLIINVPGYMAWMMRQGS